MLTVTRSITPDLDRFTEYLRSSFRDARFSNGGPLSSLLELRLRELTAARQFSLVSSGTMALEIALRALGIRGEVITTPFTFCATSHAIAYAGARPVFADIDPKSLTLSPDAIVAAITDRTEAILPVHVYGHPCEVQRIEEIARQHGLAVVYDGAHAFNSSHSGIPIGHFGDATAYSFHATKVFHTAEGGAVETTDPALADKVRLLRNFGIESEGRVVACGTNGKMSELSAAMGLAVLDCIHEEHAARAGLRTLYEDLLADTPGIAIHTIPKSATSGLYFIIRVDGRDDPTRRDRLQTELAHRGILARRYFFPLTSEAPFFSASTDPRATPNALRSSREVLALPFHGGIRKQDAERVVSEVDRFMREELG